MASYDEIMEELEEIEEILPLFPVRGRKIFGQRIDYFNIMGDEEFQNRFRLSKNTFVFLHSRIEGRIMNNSDR